MGCFKATGRLVRDGEKLNRANENLIQAAQDLSLGRWFTFQKDSETQVKSLSSLDLNPIDAPVDERICRGEWKNPQTQVHKACGILPTKREGDACFI